MNKEELTREVHGLLARLDRTRIGIRIPDDAADSAMLRVTILHLKTYAELMQETATTLRELLYLVDLLPEEKQPAVRSNDPEIEKALDLTVDAIAGGVDLDILTSLLTGLTAGTKPLPGGQDVPEGKLPQPEPALDIVMDSDGTKTPAEPSAE